MITATATNLHIEKGHDYSKHQFGIVLQWAAKEFPYCEVLWERTRKSLKLEWAAHNLAYKLNYKRERVKDVDLNYPQKWYVSLMYAIVGSVAMLIIN